MANMLRLSMIGKTGAGKSRFGNTVLGERVFKSSSSGSSVTTDCQLRNKVVFGRNISIVDTPGFNDTREENQDKILKEITRSIYISAPGPHAICFVVQVGRFTMEDIDTINAFVRHFGEALYEYVIVVFTKYDDYKRECEEDRIPCDIKNYVKTLPLDVKQFVVEKCGSRIIGFDNTLKGDDSKAQVIELIKMVDDIVKKNGGTCYTNEDFKNAEAIIQKEMALEKIKLEKETQRKLEERQREIEKAADERVKIKMKKEMEDFKAEMKEKMSDANLHAKVQQSETGFDKFCKIVNALTPLAEALLKIGVDMVLKKK